MSSSDEETEEFIEMRYTLSALGRTMFTRVREEKGLRQKDLAERIGLDQALMSNFIHGKYAMEPYLIRKLYHELDRDPHVEFLGTVYDGNEIPEECRKYFLTKERRKKPSQIDSTGLEGLLNKTELVHIYNKLTAIYMDLPSEKRDEFAGELAGIVLKYTPICMQYVLEKIKKKEG